MRLTASSNVGSSKPYAKSFTMYGENMMPSMDITDTEMMRIVKTTSETFLASSFDLFSSVSVKTGMKEIVSEPSAKSLRRRFGIRKAIQKASVKAVAPKK